MSRSVSPSPSASDKEHALSASSDSDRSSSTRPQLGKRKRSTILRQTTTDESPEVDEEDVPALSHAERRRQKKKQKMQKGDQPAKSPEATHSDPKSRDAKTESSAKRQHSVWVGNLSFKTTEDALKAFFDGVGDITRIHLPLKPPVNGQRGPGVRKENRGFAYVDFATAGAKQVAIAMSEQNLDGRRLLIKDGDDFTGRPAPSADSETTASSDAQTKSARKILAAQKQPPAPTLFIGNLGFEATEESIRGMLEAHKKKGVNGKQRDEQANPDLQDNDKVADQWIRKIRLGTFEDTGKCKGWAFVDFVSVEAATCALVNPKNHKLDGRQLKVEYASADAVRRGGGSSLMPGAPTSGEKVKPRRGKGDQGPETSGFNPKKRRNGDGDGRKSAFRKERRFDDEPGLEAAPIEQEDAFVATARAEDRPSKIGPGKDRSSRSKSRAKPGAALAQAQRQSVAIQPAQGSKIVF
ncbi:hypothetical protein PUNSTDRAFT_100868 [Punctularia strigosozonata HHB-11173 SS5]|uniref:uncharacterized protein n=1 Tax=Punctularia strigosozonata (strain HHB-11173) TaxID=741275 RepID=UPI0004417133|nr:uncharacterized protein PUNSTDRAFT_100868 [Punctularia strigosozonata HHB-11173 SS5]EIN10955.1 hypothetical protein PUNSTDRAFT_100868 [Punctularia strigosozonata HHB-11173 SS5]